MPKQPWHRLYKTAAWQRLREHQLAMQPLCSFCLQGDDVEVATVVDHIKPHKGDDALFYDANNLQSLCKHCHDSAKQRIDNGKVVVTTGVDGYPL